MTSRASWREELVETWLGPAHTKEWQGLAQRECWLLGELATLVTVVSEPCRWWRVRGTYDEASLSSDAFWLGAETTAAGTFISIWFRDNRSVASNLAQPIDVVYISNG
jgi:hypothetical protein